MRNGALLAYATALLLALGGSPASAQLALNDTGLTTCFDDTASTGGIEPATHPKQDCRTGRDPAAAAGFVKKVGAGTKAFDFTKISNAGAALPAGAALGSLANDWGCTYDNLTGLMWEMKTTGSTDLRYFWNTYTWYSTDPTVNGGDPGYPDGGNCHGGIACDTQSYETAVKAVGICGHTDWRLPTLQELNTLVDFSHYHGEGVPSIDTTYFPTLQFDEGYWSRTSDSKDPGNAWYVYYNGGYTVSNRKNLYEGYTMLVRSGK
jgi:hypothetical protein